MSEMKGLQAKVCIITTVHPPFDTRIFHKQAKTLVRAGYDVTLIAQYNRDKVVNGVRIIALPKPRNRFTRIFGLTWRAFHLALHQRADIYHFHDPELLIVGMLLKLITRAKVIYDVHEDYPQMIRIKYWIPKPLRILASLIMSFIESIGAHLFDAVITVTESIQARFPSNKGMSIKNYPSLDLERRASNSARSGSEINIIYVGGLNRGRGIHEIIKAMEYLDKRWNMRLRLLGRFDEPNTENEIRVLSGFKHVELVGWVLHPQVYDYLHTSHIGLVCLHPIGDYPLGLPVKLFEYMAAGLPVIASNFPLWKEIVERNECGLTVDPLDPKEIAQAIEYLLVHPEEAQRMGENGRRAVEEKYNWEQESEKLVELYEELLTRAQ